MNRPPHVLALALFVCLSVAGGSVPAQPADSRVRAVAGARGVVRTVVDADRIEEIPVRFLGTYEGVLGPGRDLYLVELEGPVGENVGVASGMSGSPVYVDGEIVGALAYRYGLIPRRAVAGVTPIEDVMDASLRGAGSQAAHAAARPIATPVSLGGAAGAVREWLAPQLEQRGLVVVPGAAGVDTTEPAALAPGMPIGVRLVGGDWTAAATGTVTWIDGDVVYAFGHPLFGSGRAELPMTAATVVHTMADMTGSFRLVNLGPEIGAIVEDRLTAIVGRKGARARVVPMRVHLRGAHYGERTLHYELAPEPALLPQLAGAAAANALLRDPGYDSALTAIGRGEIRVQGQPALPVEFAFSGETASHPAIALANRLRQILGSVMANAFSAVTVDEIRIDLEVALDRREYTVDTLLFDRGPVRRGERRVFECTLRSYRGETIRRSFEIEIPEEIEPGNGLLLAVGSDDFIRQTAGNTIGRQIGSAADLPSVVRALADLRSPNRLTAALLRPSPGLVASGGRLDGLPGSAAGLIASAAGAVGSTAPTRSTEVLRREHVLDGPVSGGRTVRLRVGESPADEESP